MPMKVHPNEIPPLEQKNNVSPHRPVPLSTRQIIIAIISLSIFSFLYLGYAQHHAILFYIMTGLVAIFIVFVYTLGIIAVLYMAIHDYESDEKDSNSSGNVEESAI